MPISVPKNMRHHLEEAMKHAEGALTAIDQYDRVKKALKSFGVDFETHKDESTVPGHHSYWKP